MPSPTEPRPDRAEQTLQAIREQFSLTSKLRRAGEGRTAWNYRLIRALAYGTAALGAAAAILVAPVAPAVAAIAGLGTIAATGLGVSWDGGVVPVRIARRARNRAITEALANAEFSRAEQLFEAGMGLDRNPERSRTDFEARLQTARATGPTPLPTEATYAEQFQDRAGRARTRPARDLLTAVAPMVGTFSVALDDPVRFVVDTTERITTDPTAARTGIAMLRPAIRKSPDAAKVLVDIADEVAGHLAALEETADKSDQPLNRGASAGFANVVREACSQTARWFAGLGDTRAAMHYEDQAARWGSRAAELDGAAASLDR